MVRSADARAAPSFPLVPDLRSTCATIRDRDELPWSTCCSVARAGHARRCNSRGPQIRSEPAIERHDPGYIGAYPPGIRENGGQYTHAATWLGWAHAALGDGELRIEPCIPSAWKGFEAWVRMGAQQLHVVVENPDAVGSGVATVTLDGAPLDSNRIHLDPSVTGEHEVRVRLGKGRSATHREELRRYVGVAQTARRQKQKSEPGCGPNKTKAARSTRRPPAKGPRTAASASRALASGQAERA